MAPGFYRGKIQCREVQALTYVRDRFDLCTSTEVFEHAPDNGRGFAEIFRVMRPGGVEHLLPEEYHRDLVGHAGRILAFHNDGADIVDRWLASGFARAKLRMADQPSPRG